MKISFVLLCLLPHILPANEDCIAACGPAALPPTVCARDGQLYSTPCIALCQNPDNYPLASYSDLPQEDAAAQCSFIAQRHSCFSNCGSNTEPSLYYCTNFGTVYSQLCRARCVEPLTEFQWECSQIGWDPINCQLKCRKYSVCHASCEGQSAEPHCAQDGLVYKGSCLLECLELKELTDGEGQAISAADLCLGEAKQRAPEGLGPRLLK